MSLIREENFSLTVVVSFLPKKKRILYKPRRVASGTHFQQSLQQEVRHELALLPFLVGPRLRLGPMGQRSVQWMTKIRKTNLVNDRIEDMNPKQRPAYVKLTGYQTNRPIIWIHSIETIEVERDIWID